MAFADKARFIDRLQRVLGVGPRTAAGGADSLIFHAIEEAFHGRVIPEL